MTRRVLDRRKRLGQALRALRQRTGLDPAAAGAVIGWAPERLERMEAGLAVICRADAKELFARYGAGDESMLMLLEGTSGWWTRDGELVDEEFETMLVLEQSADRLSSYHNGLIPGLLQTPGYSWELISTMSDQPLDRVERLAELRRRRGRALEEEPRPLLTVVLDEAALLRPVGGPTVMRVQYEHLLAAARAPRVELRVLPLTAGPHRATSSAFQLFEFAEDDPVVQLELLDRVHFIWARRQSARYRDAFDRALAGTLDPDDSAQFIADLAARCRHHAGH